MPEVDLTLIANNQPYITSVKEAERTYQQFHDTVRKGEKEEEGLIGSTVAAIEDYEKARKKAWTTTDIEKYNKKIAEAKQTLNEYNQLGVKTQDKQKEGWSQVTSWLTKAAGALLAYHTVMKVGEKIISATEALHHKWEVALKQVDTALNFVARSIASMNFENFTEGIRRSIDAAKDYVNAQEQIANRANSLSIALTQDRIKQEELQTIMRETGRSDEERLKAANEAKLIGLSISDRQKKLVIDTYETEINLITKSLPGKRKYTDLGRSNLEYLLRNYDVMLPLIKQAEEYNEKIATLNDLIKKQNQGGATYGMGGMTTNNIVDHTEAIKKLTEETKNADQTTKFWAYTLRQFGLTTPKERKNLAQLFNAIGQAELEGVQRTKRANIMISSLEEEIRNKREQAAKEARDRELKRQEEYLKLSEDLRKRYDQAGIAALTGKEKIKAEENLANEELDRLIIQLQKVGELTWQQDEQIKIIRTRIHTETLNKLKEIDDKELTEKIKHNKELLDISEQLEMEVADLSEHAEEEKLKVQIRYLAIRIKMLNEENTVESRMASAQLQNVMTASQNALGKLVNEREQFSIYKLLGIDLTTEQGKREADMVDQAAAQIKDAIQTVMDAEIEAAELHTDLIEKKISEKENELDEEKRLAEEGLANNVDATKKELALLNTEKKKALDEERRLKQQQITIDTVAQTSKLALSAVELFSSQASKGIVGVVIAAGLIASMFGIIASARAKAKALEQETQLGEGGYIDEYGVVKGKKHSQGGERLLDKISVEKDEGISVFSAKATRYYGNLLPKWTASINSMQFPKFDNIKPSLTQSNTYNLETKKVEKKLDSINDGIRILNSNLLNQQDTSFSGRKRIQKLSKNHTRVITN